MKIFHRIDDVGYYSDQMIEILNYFEQHTKEFIIAAIPKIFDERYVAVIKKYKHCSVFQHGYEHVNHVDKGWCDEFPDHIDYQQRLSLLAEGKSKIEKMFGTEIKGYVPPWNNTGRETIDIISKLGFSIYSSQENNTVLYKYNKDILIDVISEYTPIIVYKDLNQVYKEIVEMQSEREKIGIMYHFSNTSPEDLERIKGFLNKVEEINYK